MGAGHISGGHKLFIVLVALGVFRKMFPCVITPPTDIGTVATDDIPILTSMTCHPVLQKLVSSEGIRLLSNMTLDLRAEMASYHRATLKRCGGPR